MAVGRSKPPWIAARFEGTTLPGEMKVGDGTRLGTREYVNHPLYAGVDQYQIFLRAVVNENVRDITK